MIHFQKNKVVIDKVKDFDLVETFNCGQCFRWNQVEENVFVGVAFGRVLRICMEGTKIILSGNSVAHDYEQIWKNYFDFDTNYEQVRSQLSTLDDNLQKACKYASGIRILQQEPWETLCSFIISQNNNIPRIKGIIEHLCAHWGKELEPGYFSFPSCETLAKLNAESLSVIKCGFRDKYIIDAARKVASGSVSLDTIRSLPLEMARTELMKIKGVGPKVAECTLLYGFHRFEAFPIDVWMKRAMDSLFPGKKPEHFGEYAGIAQQYIFHYTRMNPNLVK